LSSFAILAALFSIISISLTNMTVLLAFLFLKGVLSLVSK